MKRGAMYIRATAGVVGIIGLATFIGLTMANKNRSANSDTRTSSASPSVPSGSDLPLVQNEKGHGDINATGAASLANAPSPAKPASTPASSNAAASQPVDDPYLQYEKDLVKQQLAEKLQEQARFAQERAAAIDAPLARGNYTPALVNTATAGGSAAITPELGGAGGPVGAGSSQPVGQSAGTGQATVAGQGIGKGPAPAANTATPDVGYLTYGAIPARSPYEIKKGSVIPAVLLTGINSNLPGSVTAQVSENVYDSVTGESLLIPAGSRLFGTYDSNVKYGQNRAVVLWSHLIFPNGATLLLENQIGTDTAGQSGFHDIRRGNFWRILGANLLFSIVGAGQQAFEARLQSALSNSASTTSAIGNLITGAAGVAAGNAASSAAGVFNAQNASVQPTLIIRPGYQFNVLVAKDIVLKPWGTQ